MFRRSLCVQRWGQGWSRQEQACSVLTDCGKLVHFEERCSVWPLLPFQVIGVLLCGSVLPTRPQWGGSLVLRVWFWGPKVACVCGPVCSLGSGKGLHPGAFCGEHRNWVLLKTECPRVPHHWPPPLRLSPRGPARSFIGIDI